MIQFQGARSLYQNSCLKAVGKNTFLIVVCLYWAIEAAGIVPELGLWKTFILLEIMLLFVIRDGSRISQKGPLTQRGSANLLFG